MEKVGGREAERRVRRLDLFSPGFCLCGSVELFLPWKNFLSLFCLSFPPPPFFSDSIFLSFSVHFSPSLLHLPPSQFPLFQSLCSLCPALHHSSSLHVLSHLSLFLSYFLSLSPPFFRWPPLSAFLLPSYSVSILPGCISSRRASPKRY